MTEELPHIRCLECGKPISHNWDKYQRLLSGGLSPEQALNEVGLTRYCCRMWMQSPFKVPMRSERQIDPRDTGLEQQATTLTIAAPPQPTLAPLQAMANPQTVPQTGTGAIPGIVPTTAYTVVPLEGTMTEIGLPAIPEVALPEIPTLTGAEKPTEQAVTRIYQAW